MTHVVRWCFHTTAMVADYERTRDALAWLVGSRALEDHRYEDPAVGRRGGMTWIGDNSIELGEPIVAGGAVDRFVSRLGSHMSSIAVQVADIDATVAHLESLGARVASRVDEVIVFTDPATTAGVVVEWYGGQAPNDPRFGTVIPSYPVEPLLDVVQMAFGGAVVVEPAAAAERLAALLDTAVTFVDEAAPAGSPQAGVSLGDMTLALYPMPVGDDRSRRLWGHVYRRPQTGSLGVRVPDLGAARSALVGAGVPLVRHDDDVVVVHPEATGGVIVVVVDALLPGDPRA
ncbi:MAG TPA: VOC family protein [Acidimicrobiales bacterium]|nr:VOC family protein [Acidimicrobiales bacterium]